MVVKFNNRIHIDLEVNSSKNELIAGIQLGNQSQAEDLLENGPKVRTPLGNQPKVRGQLGNQPKVRSQLGDELGSISPLIIFYFSITLILIFLISNVASLYIARRDLTSRAEAALSVAAQELDEFRYYYGAPLTDFLAQDAIASGKLRVPIDCADASRKFLQVLHSGTSPVNSKQDLSGKVNVESIRCDGYDISAKISQMHELPFQLRVFGINSYLNRVEVGTASYLLSNDS